MSDTNDIVVQYEWTCRLPLVERARELRRIRKSDFTSDSLEEWLTDLSKSGSWMASEAKAAIHRTSDAQWLRLMRDVNQE